MTQLKELGEHTMNSNLMHQVAQDRRADLMREAEAYRRARLTARPTVLTRIGARLPRLPTGSRINGEPRLSRRGVRS
jgi:hypothetical protein